MSTSPRMKVEVWSDIMCPFCYIGKRNYETALAQLPGRDQIEIEWRSFQLDPTIPEHAAKKENVYQYLSDKKGMSYEQSVKLHETLTQTANNAGLTYNFDISIVANSFSAHKLIQLAKTKGLGDQAEERLFHAYFTEGLDMGDRNVLIDLGRSIGLNADDVATALDSPEFSDKVNQDIHEARQIGVTGVPFFVLDRKYAIAGAQPPTVFAEALQQALQEWQKKQPANQMQVTEGAVCTPEGECK